MTILEDIKIRDLRYSGNPLERALRMERLKYKRCPVGAVAPREDLELEQAQLWGYVVAAYSLLEQGLKMIPCVRDKKKLITTHALLELFNRLRTEDQELLRKYYNNRFRNLPEMKLPPWKDIIPDQFDKFLENLDKDHNARGSFYWRYSPTQIGGDGSLPPIHIGLMHEMIFGCVTIITLAQPKRSNEAADLYKYGWIRRYAINEKVLDWIAVCMNQPDWDMNEGRIQILWGPDCNDRYDYMVFDGNHSWKLQFDKLSKAREIGLEIVDKRSELEVFDPDEE